MKSPGYPILVRLGVPIGAVIVLCVVAVALVENTLTRILVTLATLAVVGFILAGISARLRRLAIQGRRVGSLEGPRHISEAPEREISEVAAGLRGAGERLAAATQELAVKRAQLDALVNAVEVGVVILDVEQRMTLINPAAARMMGSGPRDLRGQLVHEVVRAPAFLKFINDVMERPRLASAEMEFVADSRRAMRVTSVALTDRKSLITGAVVLLTDLTEMKRLESVRSDFAANVSHELRTPITNIKGYAETLLEIGLSDPELAVKFLKIVATNADRLGAIVDDILALTNLERSEADDTLVTSEGRLRPILEAARVQHATAAMAKQIEVLVEAPADLTGQVNARLLEQGVGNLIDNAVKYSPAGTRVHVKAERINSPVGPMLEISVADEGPGIAQEHLSRIFERFYRVDKARSREQGGTGLGLAIVKHIATAHGGQITVESTPGKGSTFRMSIPDPAGFTQS